VLPPSGSRPLAKAGWNETIHPRAVHGKFTFTAKQVGRAARHPHQVADLLPGTLVHVKHAGSGHVVQSSGKHVTVRHTGGVTRTHPRVLVKVGKTKKPAHERKLKGRRGRIEGRQPYRLRAFRMHKPKVNGKVIKEADHEGVMVALYPDGTTRDALARDGGEPADDLHVTLSYLGSAHELDTGQRAQLVHIVNDWAKATPPLDARVGGVGHFDEGGCTYASVDCPHLNEARAELHSRLRAAGLPVADDHGFTPHITLAYDEDEAEGLESVPAASFKVDGPTVMIGGERHEMKFSGVSKGDESAGMRVSGDGQATPTSPLTSRDFNGPGEAPLTIRQGSSGRRRRARTTCPICGQKLNENGRCPTHGVVARFQKARGDVHQWETLLEQGHLKQAFDTARERFESAAQPHLQELARKAVRSALGPGAEAAPPVSDGNGLTRALAGETDRLYEVGRDTVLLELRNQHHRAGTGLRPVAPEDVTQRRAHVTSAAGVVARNIARAAVSAAAAEASRRPLVRKDKPQPPPKLRDATGHDRCQVCLMFDEGKCWGYGEYKVRPDQVCDSFSQSKVRKDEEGDEEELEPTAEERHNRLYAAALAAAESALRNGALLTAAYAINSGRSDAAETNAGQIAQAIYTSVMDENTCDECASDNGTAVQVGSIEYYDMSPPNEDCEGGDRCRCVWIYTVSDSLAAFGLPEEGEEP